MAKTAMVATRTRRRDVTFTSGTRLGAYVNRRSSALRLHDLGGALAGSAVPREAVLLGQLRIVLRELLGQVDHHLALLPGGVVLHLAVDHVDAGAVRNRLDHLLRELDLVRRRREDLLGDLDLHGVQRPGPDAAEQEGGAELGLAALRVLDVAV